MKDKHCCESFKDFIPLLNWFAYDDIGVKIYVMPYMQIEQSNKLRVNYCPSCGTEIRDIELTEI